MERWTAGAGWCLVILAAMALTAGDAGASGFDIVAGVGRIEGPFLGEADQDLDDLFLQVEFGGASSRLTVRTAYLRMNHTGLVTWATDGPVILGAGGPGKPPWQESDAGDGSSGFGDVLIRSENYIMKAGAGNRPSLAFVVDFKWATADQGEGLGTGETDWGGGLDYVQPIGKMFQILGSASYHFMGSPEGADFQDRLRLMAGFGLLSAHTAWRLGYETVSPVLDEVPLYDTLGAPIGVVAVEDYEVVRGEVMFRNQAGGSVKIWALAGMNDSSPDMGFGLTFASRAQ